MIHDVMAAAKRFMSEELGLEAQIVSVDASGNGWTAMAEAIVDDPSMRALARKDLVVCYELRLDDSYVVQSFERKAMRERGSVAP